jgi:hypothetical protein
MNSLQRMLREADKRMGPSTDFEADKRTETDGGGGSSTNSEADKRTADATHSTAAR